jgi:hypothetical protein
VYLDVFGAELMVYCCMVRLNVTAHMVVVYALLLGIYGVDGVLRAVGARAAL